jgi:hypothetical protein
LDETGKRLKQLLFVDLFALFNLNNNSSSSLKALYHKFNLSWLFDGILAEMCKIHYNCWNLFFVPFPEKKDFLIHLMSNSSFYSQTPDEPLIFLLSILKLNDFSAAMISYLDEEKDQKIFGSFDRLKSRKDDGTPNYDSNSDDDNDDNSDDSDNSDNSSSDEERQENENGNNEGITEMDLVEENNPSKEDVIIVTESEKGKIGGSDQMEVEKGVSLPPINYDQIAAEFLVFEKKEMEEKEDFFKQIFALLKQNYGQVMQAIKEQEKNGGKFPANPSQEKLFSSFHLLCSCLLTLKHSISGRLFQFKNEFFEEVFVEKKPAPTASLKELQKLQQENKKNFWNLKKRQLLRK